MLHICICIIIQHASRRRRRHLKAVAAWSRFPNVESGKSEVGSMVNEPAVPAQETPRAMGFDSGVCIYVGVLLVPLFYFASYSGVTQLIYVVVRTEEGPR